jgi:hypothetical protein
MVVAPSSGHNADKSPQRRPKATATMSSTSTTARLLCSSLLLLLQLHHFLANGTFH